jgi:hypothetical protein
MLLYEYRRAGQADSHFTSTYPTTRRSTLPRCRPAVCTPSTSTPSDLDVTHAPDARRARAAALRVPMHTSSPEYAHACAWRGGDSRVWVGGSISVDFVHVRVRAGEWPRGQALNPEGEEEGLV